MQSDDDGQASVPPPDATLFSAPFRGWSASIQYPGMAKPYAFRASYFTAQAKERISHEIAEARELGTSWPQVAGRYDASERAASAWTGKDMSPATQHAQRGSTGQPRMLTEEEEQEIFD
jgi:hypothetical protein